MKLYLKSHEVYKSYLLIYLFICILFNDTV
jgi:hypothetical protein